MPLCAYADQLNQLVQSATSSGGLAVASVVHGHDARPRLDERGCQAWRALVAAGVVPAWRPCPGNRPSLDWRRQREGHARRGGSEEEDWSAPIIDGKPEEKNGMGRLCKRRRMKTRHRHKETSQHTTTDNVGTAGSLDRCLARRPEAARGPRRSAAAGAAWRCPTACAA